MTRRIHWINGLGEFTSSEELAKFYFMQKMHYVVINWRSGDAEIITDDRVQKIEEN